MIKAEPGHHATFYKYDDDNPEREPRTHGLPVKAWDDDGHPMVVTETGLVRAENAPGEFADVQDDADTPIAVLPGGGWRIKTDEFTYVSVIGWAVYHDRQFGGTHASPIVPQKSGALALGTSYQGGSGKLVPPRSHTARDDA